MIARVVAALLFACVGAQAATLSGATFPDSYPVEGQALALNGMGLRTLTILEIKVYVAGLYLARPSSDAQQILASSAPKVLLLQFLRGASKEQIEKQFRAGEIMNCGDGSCNRADQDDFDRMVAAAPATNAGDTYSFIITAHGGAVSGG